MKARLDVDSAASIRRFEELLPIAKELPGMLREHHEAVSAYTNPLVQAGNFNAEQRKLVIQCMEKTEACLSRYRALLPVKLCESIENLIVQLNEVAFEYHETIEKPSVRPGHPAQQLQQEGSFAKWRPFLKDEAPKLIRGIENSFRKLLVSPNKPLTD